MTEPKTPSTATRRRRVRAWYSELLADIPEGFTPLEAALSVKCIDHEGNVCLINQTTSGLNIWEALGMLISAGDDMRARLSGCADDEDDE